MGFEPWGLGGGFGGGGFGLYASGSADNIGGLNDKNRVLGPIILDIIMICNLPKIALVFI